MEETLLESKVTHYETSNPYILLKKKGKKYYIEILNHKGDKYEQKRKGGIYTDYEYYKNYNDAENTFIMLSLRYAT